MRQNWAIFGAVLLWIPLVVAGEALVLRYDFAPAARHQAPLDWPKESQIAPSKSLPTLVLFAHPKCPCTRATIDQLTHIMTRLQGKVAATVLFIRPANMTQEWVKTDLWKNASRIPGVQVLEDLEGVEARFFNSTASGQTLLYDTDGKLMYEGGITLSRGHFGDSPGSRMIRSLVDEGPVANHQSAAVFGCPLFEKPKSMRSI